MNRLTILIMALALAAPAAARPRQEVAAAEAAWTAAILRRDGPMLQRLVAAEYTLSGEPAEGRPPVSRSVWIDNALHHLRLKAARFETLSVEVHGGQATARGLFYWAGAFDGEAFAERTRLEDRWTWREGRWQVVARRVLDQP